MDNLDLKRIFARNCSVRRIDTAEAAPFFEANHRMGYCVCRHRYGLFVDRVTGSGESELPKGTLVAAAGFSSPRNMTRKGGNPRSFEWIRYASLAGYRVVGGMGKLMNVFVSEMHPDDIMTYVRTDESEGDSFRALGFVCEGKWGKKEWNYENYKFRKIF